jgi:hypothetical protein
VRDHQHGHVDVFTNHKPFLVKRYVLCSVMARQPWLLAVIGMPSHEL